MGGGGGAADEPSLKEPLPADCAAAAISAAAAAARSAVTRATLSSKLTMDSDRSVREKKLGTVREVSPRVNFKQTTYFVLLFVHSHRRRHSLLRRPHDLIVMNTAIAAVLTHASSVLLCVRLCASVALSCLTASPISNQFHCGAIRTVAVTFASVCGKDHSQDAEFRPLYMRKRINVIRRNETDSRKSANLIRRQACGWHQPLPAHRSGIFRPLMPENFKRNLDELLFIGSLRECTFGQSHCIRPERFEFGDARQHRVQ